MQDLETIEIGPWVIRQRQPVGQGQHPVVLMLHGWTGDEKVMWVFASRVLKNALILAPRGLYATPLGGYGWHDHQSGQWPFVSDFRPAVDALLDLLRPQNFTNANLDQVHLVGFSQGAALSFSIGLLHPGRVASISALSGFLPQGTDEYVKGQPLSEMPVFITHGAQDDVVPVEKARQAVERMKSAGSKVVYCEADVGHKLGAPCLESLEKFHAGLS